jgi:hypothetical protein
MPHHHQGESIPSIERTSFRRLRLPAAPLMSNVEVVDKPLFVVAREHSKRDDARACEFGCSKIAKAPRAGNAADKGFRLA